MLNTKAGSKIEFATNDWSRMLDFKPITSDRINEINTYLSYKKSRTCDSTIGSLFMWRDYYSSEYAIYNEMIFMKVVFTDNQTSFIVPFGKNSTQEALNILNNYANENNIPLSFVAVSEEALKELQDFYKERIEFSSDRDYSDYLYLAENLSELKGRRYSGQRNHINKFKKLYPEYKYIKFNDENIEKVIRFYEEYSKNMGKSADTAVEENKRALEILHYYEKFPLVGGFIEVDDKIIAISVGEIINDTLYVHIEKALKDYPGSYQMIMNEFSKNSITEKVVYINREEDTGDLGLRTSKLSYHPYQLLDKYVVKVNV